MKKSSNIAWLLAACLLATPSGLRAQEEEETAPEPVAPAAEASKLAIELGAPFRDNAVLQREMKLPVWGWSKPGTTVTVTFAGQKKSATAAKDGKWMLELDPLKASFEPAEMVIQESGFSGHEAWKKVVLKNLLVGEVWFASGQSNMQWPAAACDVALLQQQITERVAAGKEQLPVIREGTVTNYYAALHPIERANGSWHDDALKMSAVAYSFAYHVFREIKVPVGILNCSFSQTSIQSWTPRNGFRDGNHPKTKEIYQKLLQTDPSTPEHKQAWDTYYAEIESDLKAGREVDAEKPGNMDSNRDATWLFNARINPMIPYAVRGGIWNQGYANMGEGLTYYNNLHSLIGGWRECWNKPDMPVYFNQFYCPGTGAAPTIGGVTEMRLGTWLARDIPHTGMGSQIDISGAIHYYNKTVSGKRMALHALKNEYASTTLSTGGKAGDLVADGPMFKSYRVDGDRVIVELEHTDGGLVVAETGTNSQKGLAVPKIIPDGASQVKFLYLAGEDRVWFPAQVKIDGNTLIVTSDKVKKPRGVTYGMGGIGNNPNIYNQALLPLTPFIQYDNQMVTSETWPGGSLKLDGETFDPVAALKYAFRRLPLLSSQFVNNAVLQAGQPLTIWGGLTGHEGEIKGKAEIRFSFGPSTGSGQAGIEKTIPVTPETKDWQVIVPPMPASMEPKTLQVTFLLDGQVAHERICTNIVIGDVWFVAIQGSKFSLPETTPAGTGIVRMMKRNNKGDRAVEPRRYSVSGSTAPENRFSSRWDEPQGFAAALGNRIAAKTGKAVGIVFMQSSPPPSGKKTPIKKIEGPYLKHWIPAEDLDKAPSLMADYKDKATMIIGTKEYEANIRRYLNEWKTYWSDYVPAMIRDKAAPDGRAWGGSPSMRPAMTTDASACYNVMGASFMPGSFKGVLFLTSPSMMEADQDALFGEQMSVLANSWKAKFACEDPEFIYTIPSKTLAPKITPPTGIKGKARAIEINAWDSADDVIEAAVGTYGGRSDK